MSRKIANGLGLVLMLCLLWLLHPENVMANDSPEAVKLQSYKDYLKEHDSEKAGKSDIVIKAAEFEHADMSTEVVDDFEGKSGKSVLTTETGSIEWEINVPESGMYNLEILYYPIKGKGSMIERMVLIDGKVPYNEAKYAYLSRVWKDKGEISRDSSGNDLRPDQAEAPNWRTMLLYDSLGYYNDPLKFYLEKGPHTLSLESVKEPVVLHSIHIYTAEEPQPYAEIKAEYDKQGYKEANAKTIKIQAEHTYEKSDNTLYPISDRSSAANEPQDPSKIRLNSISGDKFKMPGQWVTYRFNVEEDGLYKIAARYKQNILSGMYSTRKIWIDGKVPFKEAETVKFNYGSKWKVEALGDGKEDFSFYLNKGEHELTLQVTLGDMAEVLSRVNDSLYELNQAYRKILMVTGTEPDLYRDYGFEKLTPDAISDMAKQAAVLRQVSADMESFVGEKGESMVLLDKIAFQLEQMTSDPERNIPKTFSAFKDNIGALGTWILKVGEQPLSLDYMSILPVSSKLSKAGPSFFKSLFYEIKSFLMSFFMDYNTLGTSKAAASASRQDSVTVWLTAGRDQLQIIREMINDSFTPQSGIDVNIKLISKDTLLPSVLAGTGPDVAMGNLVGDPIQYALRNAVENIGDMPGYQDVAARFHPSALVPYQFEGKIYALPETESFPMMFYRKDILQELGLEPPQTWDEFYHLIPELQKRNMQIGFPSDITGTQIFLYQNGGSLYNPALSQSTLDSDLTMEAFQKQSELFTTYKFPRDFDFANRFRTGEMPVGIADFTIYNQLIAFAPEIRGLWEFSPLPGTVMNDGTLNRATPSTGTGVIMLKGVANKEAAWEFMKWWTSASAQSRFGTEMEAVLGKSAKQATANMEALANMPWTKSEYDMLMKEWSFATGTPEVPGGYYVTRSFGFAAASAYNNGDSESLLDYVRETNNEIARKRREFHLE